MEELYTILAEYRGGTYVSQVRAQTPSQALQHWSGEKPAGRGDIPSRVRLEIRKQLSGGDAPVPVSGQQNVWCASGSYRDELILINVVLTRT